MKSTLFLFFCILCIAASGQQQYVREWTRIDSLIQNAGLIKSALKEVNAIYTQAKKQGNDVQVIKALTYKLQLNEQLSEEATSQKFDLLEKEVSAAKEPARSILHSIAAGSYLQYLQMNRWRLYQRTATANYESDEIQTWGLEQLYAKTTYHFEKSLSNKKLLQQTRLAKYDPIIIKGDARYLRPTLYDLLAFRALDYYRNDERYVTKPAFAFEIADSVSFADAPSFTVHKFKTRDTSSLHYRALTLYQELIAFHLMDANKAALIDADISRLSFVKNFSVLPDKDDMYRRALIRLADKFPADAFTANTYFQLAQWYADKAGTYFPFSDTTWRYGYVEARKNIDKGTALNPAKNIAAKLQNLQRQVLRPEIMTNGEQVNTVDEPFRVLVSYRNVDRVYARVVKLDYPTFINLGTSPYEPDYWKKVLALPAIKTFEVALPATGDYQQHTVEIKADALPAGQYGLLLGSASDFSSNSALALQPISVSDLSLITNDSQYYVLNRTSGRPVPKVAVQEWHMYYNSATRKQELKKATSYTTDNSGFFQLRGGADVVNYVQPLLELKHGNDKLFITDTYSVTYSPYMEYDKPIVDETFYFTDRGIYRPGQTVYFKGIFISKHTRVAKSSVIVNKKITVLLLDANNQPVDSVALTSNEFGSVSGKFTLPSGQLNGTFQIRSSDDQTHVKYIRVEEYKRPKFIVEIAAVGGEYRLNDTISIKGTASSYAGNKIGGANVKFRVLRRANMPMWTSQYQPRIWPPYPQEQSEIANGTLTTDDAGNFEIKFKATPDNRVQRSFHPVFTFSVSVDVTDINGETRSANSVVSVAYEALKVTLDVPGSKHIDSMNAVKVFTTNMSDSFQRTSVQLSAIKLTAPARKFRKRYWPEPDQHVMSKEEYYKTFLYDLYADEMNMDKWPRAGNGILMTANSTPDGTFRIDRKAFQPGWYVVECKAADKFGDTVSAKKYVLIYDDNNLPTPLIGSGLFADNARPAPGETVNYKFVSNADSVFLIHDFVRRKKVIRETLDNTSKFSDKIKIEASDNGQLFVKTAFVKNNRVYGALLELFVENNERQLDIEFSSFRQKSEPGSKETWKLKVKGYKGEKAASEILTSMYDQSLDAYYEDSWVFNPFIYEEPNASPWNGNHNFANAESIERYLAEYFIPVREIVYDRLKVPYDGIGVEMTKRSMVAGVATAPGVQQNQASEVQLEEKAIAAPAPNAPANEEITIRKNLNETAFFFPDLHTDSAGNVDISFVSPEALTTWKWRVLAHTKNLAQGYNETSVVTQKQLMVQPSIPRFVREGDSVTLAIKVANVSDKPISGQATIQLIDALTGKEIKELSQITNQHLNFQVPAQQSVPVSFNFKVPKSFTSPILWRIVARSTDKGVVLSDGEEDILPVLSNRMMVTETRTLPMRDQKSKTFSFDKLLQSGESTSLKNHALTIEFTSNPAWYAVQALPYLSETKNESSEQVFARFYANALASHIANSAPRVKQVLDKWRTTDTAALLSNLQKNEDLKLVLLQETPWVLEAKSEAQQKRNVALLFELSRISNELSVAFGKFESLQNPSGAFTWLPGGPDDRFMTQYIVTGLGRLKKLNAMPSSYFEKTDDVTRKAVTYLDQRLKHDYDITQKDKKVATQVVDADPLYYLYMRSFFPDVKMLPGVQSARKYFMQQATKNWVKQSTYMRAMIALTLYRTGDVTTAKKIIAALKESSIVNEETGMYWKDMNGGYRWYEAPVETQSLLIEAFNEITGDEKSIAAMNTWLLKNKQTNSWNTSKATADACYALLLQGADWLSDQPKAQITVGDKKIISNDDAEAGTGYFRQTIQGDSIKPSMGKIVVDMQTEKTGRPAWGAVYWQYFEDIDKITNAATSLKIRKQLFVQKNTDRGPVMEPVNNRSLRVGDRIKVRLELRTDRDMEYVQLKDMRAACLEPVSVLSEYKWQGGVGYYETTRDASVNYFFSYLPKGVHVFEYDLFVTHTGRFSNGIASVQCMYAPEFSSHSEGITVNVMDK